MKNNIKLFFKSLFSNNACIDGARKKPWYAAIIIFFVSLVLSVVPTTVLQLNKQADKNFDSTTYLTNQAIREFAKDLHENAGEDKMYIIKQDKKAYLAGFEGYQFETTFHTANADVTFKFVGATTEQVSNTITYLKEQKVSYFVFTSEDVFIRIVNPVKPGEAAVDLACYNAYKHRKLEKDSLKTAYVEGSTYEESVNKTWANWKLIIRRLYNQTRLRLAGTQLGIMSAINFGIILIMGFMVWVLTRGKNNPYRLFSVWECFKIVFWADLTPAILTCGFGFLIKTFASMMFPLLLGVRIMWLSMKSLRPDGSGYAAN